MADYDTLIRLQDAALACNEAAKCALALQQWTISEEDAPLSPFALPFPRGQTLSGRPGEPFEEAVRRGAAAKWIGEIQSALDGWNAVVRVPECLEQIKRAAVSLHLPPLQIGIDSFSTAHEAAHRRATELLYFLQGRVRELSDEIRMDLRGRIQQEHAEAAGRKLGQNDSINGCRAFAPSLCRQEQALKTIIDALERIQGNCKLHGLVGLLDLHRSLQRFFCQFLNEAFKLNLIELDNIQPNFPAIDLGDKGARRCFQVTSDKSKAKVQGTIKKYVKQRLHDQYGRLTIVVIGNRQKSYKGLIVPDAIQFDPGKEILGIPELVKHVKTLETPALERLVAVIGTELHIAPLPGL
jgi:hypothetical protein